MNNCENDRQKKLRTEISNINANTALSSAEKEKEISQLMKAFNKIEPTITNNITSNKIEKCPHYQRECQIQCPTCEEFFNCRICHDNYVEDHALNRFTVDTVKCNICKAIQPINLDAKCSKCECIFAKYYCNTCHLFEDDQDKEIYHCNKCGICRVGIQENYHHCHNCNICIHIDSYETHKCFKNTWDDCPICMETLKDSIIPLFLLPCGHGTHLECIKTLMTTDYRCPLCKKCVGDMSHVWEKMRVDLDNVRANVSGIEIMNDGIAKQRVCICNDCENTFESAQNVFNMYSCPSCYSFNCS